VGTSVQPPGLRIVEHVFSVPLDHARADGERIEVFAREVADPEGVERPFLVFFQGGPGYEAARPQRNPSDPGWLERALREFRVLLLDQRGTGRSTPVGGRGDLGPQGEAERLRHFRADAIVADAEWIRRELGVERWSVLGQSFGGFCVLRYLSSAPDGLREAFVTGGLPPLGNRIDDVYRATYGLVVERSRAYFARYPDDRERVRAVFARLEQGDLRLPSGDRLSRRRLRQLGGSLGMSASAEKLHYVLELDAESPGFVHDVDAALPFARNPIYAILHEASWADGGATRWSAERMLPAAYAAEPELFTGEHVYPWMFEEYAGLSGLAGAAELLAGHEWPGLYDSAQLARNEVPVAAAIYAEDMYVPRAFSEETAAAVRGLRAWVTNEYNHDALRVDGDRVLGRLIDMARGRI
jgi:pimeloyl-ACP methyl ester carboxylesterase